MTLRYLSSALVLTWALVSTARAQQNDLAFIARPCPSNISSPQAHMVIPITINGISIPFVICASLGTGLTLDLSGAVPILNTTAAAAAATSIAVGGSLIGTQPTLNFISGNGVFQLCTNNVAASRIDCQPAIDSNYIIGQDGTPRAVIGTSTNQSGIMIYTAHMNPVMLGVQPNKLYIFVPNVNCGDNPALNIDGLGPLPIKKLVNGALVPLVANDCVGGIQYLILTSPLSVSNTVDAFILKP